MISLQHDRLGELLAACRGLRVAVFGDLMLDEYLFGTVDRISPEAPVPILSAKSRDFRPGGAANAAINIAALGGEPVLFGLIGKDWAGERLFEELTAAGIGAAGIVVDAEVQTIVKSRIIAGNQQLLRIDTESGFTPSTGSFDRLTGLLLRALNSCDALLISDYLKGAVTAAVSSASIQAAAAANKPSFLDSKRPDSERFKGIDWVAPNLSELMAAYGDPGLTLQAAAARMREALGCKAAAITCGEDGISLFSGPEWQHTHVPAVATEVFDVTGAGDTVASTLALAVVAGAAPIEAASVANLAAGVVVRKLGAAPASADDILTMHSHSTEEARDGVV